MEKLAAAVPLLIYIAIPVARVVLDECLSGAEMFEAVKEAFTPSTSFKELSSSSELVLFMALHLEIVPFNPSTSSFKVAIAVIFESRGPAVEPFP